jgi:hypothetical protein
LLRGSESSSSEKGTLGFTAPSSGRSHLIAEVRFLLRCRLPRKGKPPWSHTDSTGLVGRRRPLGRHRQPGGKDVLRGVQVPVVPGAAIGTGPFTDVQSELIENEPAISVRTALARRLPSVDHHKPLGASSGSVPSESAPKVWTPRSIPTVLPVGSDRAGSWSSVSSAQSDAHQDPSASRVMVTRNGNVERPDPSDRIAHLGEMQQAGADLEGRLGECRSGAV